jgi:hypothetical protein
VLLLLVVSAIISLFSFLPCVEISDFVSCHTKKKNSQNLLFFGDIKSLSVDTAALAFMQRYTPSSKGELSQNFIEDISAQVVVNSMIASQKFSLFSWGASFVFVAFFVMIIASVIEIF